MEIHRVLKTGGKFLFNPYSDRHSSKTSGKNGPDNLTIDIFAGTLVGFGQLCFYGRKDIDSLFDKGWKILNTQHLEIVEKICPEKLVHAEWRVIAEKI